MKYPALTAFAPSTRRLRATLCLLVAVTACDPLLATAADAEPGGTIEQFTIAPDGDGIVLPVFIGDERYWFMVDTGCGCNVIDVKLAAQRRPLEAHIRINGSKRVPVYPTRDVFVGDTRLASGADAASFDLSQIRSISGRNIRGFLGMPFLRNYVVRIDFDAGVLALLKDVPRSAGQEFKLSYDRDGRPLFDVAVLGSDATTFVVDTGFIGVGASLAVETRLFGELNRQARLQVHDIPGHWLTPEGTKDGRDGWLDEFSVGQVTHRRLAISEDGDNKIGMGLLSRYIVTFDFPKSRLYLRQGTRVAIADGRDLSGLRIWSVSGEAEIFDVRPNSPADSAGLKRGDRIRTVNGKKASAISLFEIRSLLARDKSEIRLAVERPSGDREVLIRLSSNGQWRETRAARQ